MGSFYRLKELNLRLPAGSHILTKETALQLHEATTLLETAEAEAARIRGEAQIAFEKERERGYAEGQRQADLDAVSRLVNETELLTGKLVELESELTGLVVDCVHRIMQGFNDHEKARSLIRSALQRMRKEKIVQLRVPPGWSQEIRASTDSVLSEFAEIELIDVFEDETLKPPRIIVESGLGRIDIDLERGIDGLRDLFHAISLAKGEAHG